MIDYFLPVVEADDRVKLDVSEQGQLVSNAVSCWHDWTEAIQVKRDLALEAFQMYLQNRPDVLEYDSPDDALGSSSRVRRPVLAQAVDSTLAQMHLASFPSDERFYKARPRNQEAEDNSKFYEKHVERRLSNVDFLVNVYKDRLNAVLTGVSASWHPFIRETVPKIIYEYPSFMGVRIPIAKPRKRKVESVAFEGTAFIPLQFEDWRADPLADTFKEADFIWRRWVPVEQLKAIKAFVNRDQIAPYCPSDQSDTDKDSYYDYQGVRRTYLKMDNLSRNNALLYEQWGDFYIEGKHYHNHVLIFSNDAHFHYFGPNPYDHGLKPFTVTPYIPVGGTLYGKSQAQDIIPLCHALDAFINQAIDCLSVTAKPTFTWLTDDTALQEYFGEGKVSMTAGEGIPVQSHDAIQPIVWDRQAVQEVVSLMQQVKEEIRESTGGVPYTTGGVSQDDQQRTLGEVNILASGTNTRFQLLIQQYEENKLKPYLQMIFENDRQFMTEPAFVDDEVKPLLPEDVKMMDLTFDVTGSRTVMNRAKETQELDTMIAALPAWLQSGFIVPNGDILKVNIPELLKRAANYRNIRDLDNVLEVVSPEEQQAEAPPPLGALPEEMLGGPQQGVLQLNPGAAPPSLGAA